MSLNSSLLSLSQSSSLTRSYISNVVDISQFVAVCRCPLTVTIDLDKTRSTLRRSSKSDTDKVGCSSSVDKEGTARQGDNRKRRKAKDKKKETRERLARLVSLTPVIILVTNPLCDPIKLWEPRLEMETIESSSCVGSNDSVVVVPRRGTVLGGGKRRRRRGGRCLSVVTKDRFWI